MLTQNVAQILYPRLSVWVSWIAESYTVNDEFLCVIVHVSLRLCFRRHASGRLFANELLIKLTCFFITILKHVSKLIANRAFTRPYISHNHVVVLIIGVNRFVIRSVAYPFYHQEAGVEKFENFLCAVFVFSERI